MIKAIIFDIGNVLVKGSLLKKPTKNHIHGVHEYVAIKLNIALDQYFDSIDTTYAKSMEGKLPKKKVLEIMSKNLKTTPKRLEKLYIKSYKRQFKKNKELFRLVFRLRKKGYKIAILSDQWHLSKEVLASKKLMKKFDVVVISCDVGVRKPNSKIYKIVLKKLNLPAKGCVFIDNQMWNIKPAKKLGMKTILFKDTNQLIKELNKLEVNI